MLLLSYAVPVSADAPYSLRKRAPIFHYPLHRAHCDKSISVKESVKASLDCSGSRGPSVVYADRLRATLPLTSKQLQYGSCGVITIVATTPVSPHAHQFHTAAALPLQTFPLPPGLRHTPFSASHPQGPRTTVPTLPPHPPFLASAVGLLGFDVNTGFYGYVPQLGDTPQSHTLVHDGTEPPASHYACIIPLRMTLGRYALLLGVTRAACPSQ